MNVEWMRGCATALVTPFKSDGSVDVEGMRALVERQCEGGVRVLVPCGTTGESVTMSEDENRRVISTTVEVAKAHNARVIAGAGSNSTAHAVSNALAAREAGADAVLIVAPYYNVPGRTSSNIAAETTLKLAREVENVAAVKEASGNLAQIMEILRDRPGGFLVLSGDDAMTYALLALGADGLVSVASNEAPGPMSKMVDEALAGRWDEARQLHYRWLPLMDVNFVESSPGPVKAAMALMGLVEENLRLPLVPVTEKTRARVRDVLSELGLLGESTHVTA